MSASYIQFYLVSLNKEAHHGPFGRTNLGRQLRWTDPRDRRPCRYSVYLPDLLGGRGFALDGDVAADVPNAEAALANTEALACLMLRPSSVESSALRP